MRDLVVRFTEDPDWLPSVSRDITDAIHAELHDVNADPELRSSTYASTDGVLRLIVDLARSNLKPDEAVPPPAAVDYAREYVRRGLPLDSLLAGEPVDLETSSRQLRYELDRNHQAFAVWTDAWAEGSERAFAMLEQAALEMVEALGATAPLLVPRARLCVVGWSAGGETASFKTSPSASTARRSPRFSLPSVRPRTGCPASVAATGRPSMREKSPN